MRRFLRNPSLPLFSARRIYGIPSVLAILSGAGLISALLADGLWDVVSWIALLIPAVVVVWFALCKEIKPTERAQ